MVGDNVRSVSWPYCGEIDIMEIVGRAPRELLGTVHGPGYSGTEGIGMNIRHDADFSDDFHVFAVEWADASITWLLDGVQYFTLLKATVQRRKLPWVFDHPYHILLNLAVGGEFGGKVDNDAVFPQRMEIDYVRVYQYK
jgi:beta-glucanase (GH16 family)